MQVQRDNRDGLAEAHVVGEAGTQAERGHPVQPAHSAQLVITQVGRERGGRVEVVVCRLRIRDPLAQCLQPSGRSDGDSLAVDLRGTCQRRAESVECAEGLGLRVGRFAGEPRVEQYPLVAHSSEGPARLC